MKIRSSLLLVAAAVIALTMAVFNTAAQSAPVTGAIFTTDENSNFVNANVYDTATKVYLNGGPRANAPCTSAGLPDGNYYFQVTDPSGKVLLSYDSVVGPPVVDIAQRKVNVTGGLMKSYSGTLRVPTGIGKCNSTKVSNITVRLFPYFRTPNNGGEYKVWMTLDTDYACKNAAGQPDFSQSCDIGFHGFIPSKSKTDNFKVVDYDGDKIPDSEDACPDDPNTACGIMATPVTVSMALTPDSFDGIAEGESTAFTITRTDTSGSLTVFFTLDGTATPPLGVNPDYGITGADCTELNLCSVTFSDGSSTATITLNALSDMVPEGDEKVILTVIDGPGYTADTLSEIIVTIFLSI